MTSAVTEGLLRVRLRLMLAEPYLAAAIARFPLVDGTDRPWCPTASTDGYYIYTNADFFAGLSDDDAGFVLAHEVMHCVLGHIDRRGERERLLWNVAIDYATNGLLSICGMTPPESALHHKSYDGLIAEDIYAELVRRGGLSEVEERAAESGTTLFDGIIGRMDRHIDPGDSEGADTREGTFPSAVERARLRAGLGRELRSHLPGRNAGFFTAELEAGTKPSVPWRELLSRFVTGLRRSDYRLFPPNRKHVWRGIYLPAVGVPGPEHLVVAIDTSGSMSDSDIREILGELDVLRSISECRLTVIQCDAKIHSVDNFASYETSVIGGGRGNTHRIHGRGGTDLRPPFDWLLQSADAGEGHVDALIYCTDGYGELPEAEPGIPVLWIVPRHGRAEWPWGTVISNFEEVPRRGRLLRHA